MKVTAVCTSCGREYLRYVDYSLPCPYSPPGTKPSKENPIPRCGGRVVAVDDMADVEHWQPREDAP
jgi:hypothetical protein